MKTDVTTTIQMQMHMQTQFEIDSSMHITNVNAAADIHANMTIGHLLNTHDNKAKTNKQTTRKHRKTTDT